QARDLAFKVADFAEVLIPAGPLEIQMVELPGVPSATAVELAIDENARADAGAERNKHKAARVARHAAPVLAGGRHVAVVLKVDRHAELLLKRPPQVYVLPARQVVGQGYQPRPGVHRARHADGERAQPSRTTAARLAAFRDGGMSRSRGRERQAAHAPLDLGDHSPRAVLRPDFLGGVGQEFTAEIGQRKTEVARAHVNSHYVPEARVERRLLAPVRVAHQALLVERADLSFQGGWLERQPMGEGRQGELA